MIEAVKYINKIIHRPGLRVVCYIVFLLTPYFLRSQDTVLNKHGLWIIDNVKMLQKTISKNPAKRMVDLNQQTPALILDLRYCTSNNFTMQPLYPPLKTTYLRKAAADSLSAIQKELNKLGLGIKVFDAYRPYSITEKMWEPVQDDRYAADPKKGSGHNRGAAVDLTIINLATKEELNMGTGFDNFSDTAHHAFTNLPEAVLQNRLLLKTIMEQHGFKALDTEWWHYYLPNAKDFELLDISFKDLVSKQKTKPVYVKKSTRRNLQP
jgi:D-alanyl-D-alanine dipeptidase